MKLREQLEGFKLNWLADNVKQPTGQIGMSVNTFYSIVYGRLDCPQWLIAELERITNRKIDGNSPH